MTNTLSMLGLSMVNWSDERFISHVAEISGRSKSPCWIGQAPYHECTGGEERIYSKSGSLVAARVGEEKWLRV